MVNSDSTTPHEDNLMLKAALAYTREGRKVFPCHSPAMALLAGMDERDVGKHPLLKAWQNSDLSEDDIRRRWSRKPAPNVAMRTGPETGVVVLDADTREAVLALTARGITAETTRTCRTGRGGTALHFHLLHPPEALPSRDIYLDGAKVEVKAGGRFVVVPPSLHRSGKKYEWIDAGVPIADCPAWLVETISTGRPGGGLPQDEREAMLRGVPVHERHNAIVRLAGRWRAKGLSPQEAEMLGLQWNSRLDPPEPEDNVLARIRDVYARYEGPAALAEPRGMTAAEIMLRDPRELDYVVNPLLPVGLTLYAGKPKKGKSSLARNVAVAVATGGRALGHVPVREGAVLYLAYEDSERRLRDRLCRLLQGAPAPDSLVFYPSTSPFARADRGGIEALDAWLGERPDARLVVVDTLRYFRKPRRGANDDLYEEDYQAIAQLKSLADSHSVAVLVLTHRRKADAEEPLDAVLGTTGLTGAADTVWVMQRGRGRGDAELYVVGRDVEEATLALRFDRLLLSWTLLGDAEVYRRGQERQDVIDVLGEAKEPLSPQAVARALGKSGGAVNKLMWGMARDGDLLHAERGRYALPPRELRSGTTEALAEAAARDMDAQDFYGSVSDTPHTLLVRR